MSKITGIPENIQIAGKKNIQQKADPELFQKTLEGVIGANNITQNSSPSSANALGEIRSVAPPIMEDSSVSMGSRTEKLLDQLDQYIQNLGDPRKTLKDMEPSVRDMKMSADALMESLAAEDFQDTKLKDIVEHSAMIANIEFLKFNRGDYL
ncbi:MAG: hypothetical protein ABIK15_15970 [Pseudomonadota bacterium]